MRVRRAVLVPALLLALIVLAATLAPWISPDNPYAQHLAQRRIPPVWHAWLWGDARAGWTHPLGTD